MSVNLDVKKLIELSNNYNNTCPKGKDTVENEEFRANRDLCKVAKKNFSTTYDANPCDLNLLAEKKLHNKIVVIGKKRQKKLQKGTDLSHSISPELASSAKSFSDTRINLEQTKGYKTKFEFKTYVLGSFKTRMQALPNSANLNEDRNVLQNEVRDVSKVVNENLEDPAQLKATRWLQKIIKKSTPKSS